MIYYKKGVKNVICFNKKRQEGKKRTKIIDLRGVNVLTTDNGLPLEKYPYCVHNIHLHLNLPDKFKKILFFMIKKYLGSEYKLNNNILEKIMDLGYGENRIWIHSKSIQVILKVEKKGGLNKDEFFSWIKLFKDFLKMHLNNLNLMKAKMPMSSKLKHDLRNIDFLSLNIEEDKWEVTQLELNKDLDIRYRANTFNNLSLYYFKNYLIQCYVKKDKKGNIISTRYEVKTSKKKGKGKLYLNQVENLMLNDMKMGAISLEFERVRNKIKDIKDLHKVNSTSFLVLSDDILKLMDELVENLDEFQVSIKKQNDKQHKINGKFSNSFFGILQKLIEIAGNSAKEIKKLKRDSEERENNIRKCCKKILKKLDDISDNTLNDSIYAEKNNEILNSFKKEIDLNNSLLEDILNFIQNNRKIKMQKKQIIIDSFKIGPEGSDGSIFKKIKKTLKRGKK